jgi:hypothetical protein
MRNYRLFTFVIFFLSYFFSYSQERVNRQKLVFKEKSLILNDAVGWSYNSTLGEWVDYKNNIDDNKSNNNKQEPYLVSHNPQNFISI